MPVTPFYDDGNLFVDVTNRKIKISSCGEQTVIDIGLSLTAECLTNFIQIEKYATLVPTLICYRIRYSNEKDSAQYWFEDHVHMDTAHWYGGAEIFNHRWTLENQNCPLLPYVTADLFKGQYGGIQERYFLSSKRVAFVVPIEIPLWVGINYNEDQKLKLHSQFTDSPYQNSANNNYELKLEYQIYIPKPGEFMTLAQFHQQVLSILINTAQLETDCQFLKYPIWSTWAYFKTNINESAIINYAKQIFHHAYPISILEVDDRWQSQYGDLTFDLDRFQSGEQVIEKLKNVGVPAVSLWSTPFFAKNCETILLNSDCLKYVASDRQGRPILLKWWNGTAYMLDVTNELARIWYKELHFSKLKTSFVDAFKFDAGEVNFIPNDCQLACSKISRKFMTPLVYSTQYAKLASSITNKHLCETRIATGYERPTSLVRIFDKSSVWGCENGLRAMVSTMLTGSLLGITRLLPDMVGGNAYDSEGWPSAALYIRWMQATIFMNAVQISIPPWHYSEHFDNISVVEICQRLLKLREKYWYYLLQNLNICARNNQPFLRPLWWLEENEQTLIIDDQFLIGDNLLVAPMLDPGTLRVVYIPDGSWQPYDDQNYDLIIGPKCAEISIPQSKLLFFWKI